MNPFYREYFSMNDFKPEPSGTAIFIPKRKKFEKCLKNKRR